MICDICGKEVTQPEHQGRPRKRHEGECTREAKRRRIEARRIADAIADPAYLAEEVARLRKRLKEVKARLAAVSGRAGVSKRQDGAIPAATDDSGGGR